MMMEMTKSLIITTNETMINDKDKDNNNDDNINDNYNDDGDGDAKSTIMKMISLIIQFINYNAIYIN